MTPKWERRWLKRLHRVGLVIPIVVFVVLGQAFGPQVVDAGISLEDISPVTSWAYDQEDQEDFWGASGGRVNNLAAAPGSDQVFYAATEWGGLWKTTNGGIEWEHLFNHVPMVVWDVAVDPLDPNTVYATSMCDGRINPVTGIQVSHDAGATWTSPPSANPAGLNCIKASGSPQTAPEQWHGFGIGIQPDAPENVFIGTSCGLAISHDFGDTWEFVDPCTPNPNEELRNCHEGKTYVWDVAVQGGGVDGKAIVDVCGPEGHARSLDGGETWEPHDLPYGIKRPYRTGRCSIAVSPDEPYVIFVVDDITDPIEDPDDPPLPTEYGHFAWESDNAGRNWVKLGKPDCDEAPTKRLTFLVTNKRSGRNFNLWYGEVGFQRVECETPDPAVEPGQTTVQTLRCKRAWEYKSGPSNVDPIPNPCEPPDDPPPPEIEFQWWPDLPSPPERHGAHGDSGDMAFDPTMSVDACPVLYASDGGVFIVKEPVPPEDCHSPKFTQPAKSPRALWLLGMAGSNLTNGNVALQFGVQDNGSWAAPDANVASPDWKDAETADSWSRVADSNVYYWDDQAPGFKEADPGSVEFKRTVYPPYAKDDVDDNHVYRTLIEGGFVPKIAQFGEKKYVIVTEAIDLDDDGDTDDPEEKQKVYFTEDIKFVTGDPPTPVWRKLDVDLPTGDICGVFASPIAEDPSDPVEPEFFILHGGHCGDSRAPNQLMRHRGTDSSTPWETVVGPLETLDIGIFAVDPTNPDRMYGSFRCSWHGVDVSGMYFSTNGGGDWERDDELSDMMVGKGLMNPDEETFHLVNKSGADGAYAFRAYFGGYAQPTLFAFDPDDPDYMVAGGWDSGLFLSTNGGQDWGLLTNPIQPTADTHHIPQPRYAHFKHDTFGIVWLYIGTRGRGVWRIRVREPIADAGGPYTTVEGQNVMLSALASSDPDGQPLSYAWDLNEDGVYDDALVAEPVFRDVGQDRVRVVSVKVSSGGVFSIASTTVTVTNVAPSLSVSSDAPVDENSPVTISGVVTDPGWEEDLTATINWGDGSPLEPITGVLENDRPDATLTFSISHYYGDNGTFTAEVCGYDDDTLTCTTIASQIDNVNPTADIDESTAVLVHGDPTFIGKAGEPIDFAGRCTDPGSDDLGVSWEWDDGSPVTYTMHLVNPPVPDPFPSPSVQPRDVIDEQTHTYDDACLYEIGFWCDDDDAGMSPTDTATVVIVGNAERTRAAGYWMHQYRGKGAIHFEDWELECFLEITGYMSQVFNEVTDASTIEKAFDVLFLGWNQGDLLQKFDRELLTLWLNFASGAAAYDAMVDTNFDNDPDTPLLMAVEYAEMVRLDPSATKRELEEQKKILHLISQRDAYNGGTAETLGGGSVLEQQ